MADTLAGEGELKSLYPSAPCVPIGCFLDNCPPLPPPPAPSVYLYFFISLRDGLSSGVGVGREVTDCSAIDGAGAVSRCYPLVDAGSMELWMNWERGRERE